MTNNSVKTAVAAVLGLGASLAHATNGDQMLGVTATQWGMAGAITAAPQDVGTIITNPAGLAGVEMTEFRADMGFGFMNPPREVNDVESESELYLIPSGALAFRINDRLTFGLGQAGLSGMGVDFDDTMPAAPGNQAIVTTKQFFKIAPGFAYKATDKLAVGAAFNIDYQSLAMATPNFELPQNQVYGYGATLGLTYQLNPRWRLGASYVTEQEMNEFKWQTNEGLYRMQMNGPAQLSVGLAYTPSPDLLIEADIKQIWFSDVLGDVDFKTPGGDSVIAFGWDDQTVFALGVQKALSPKTTVRFGYNYGESPIGPEDVDNNLGSLAVTEHHASLGFTRHFSDKASASFSYVRAFKNEVESNTGSGNVIELEQNVINLQLTYKN